MRKFLITAAVGSMMAAGALMIPAARAASPEGCVAASQGTSGTDGGYVAIGAVQGNGAPPSSAPTASANCAYEQTVSAVGYSAEGTYTISYGPGTLTGTTCTWALDSTGQPIPPTVISGTQNGSPPSVGSLGAAGDCVAVHTGP